MRKAYEIDESRQVWGKPDPLTKLEKPSIAEQRRKPSHEKHELSLELEDR